MPHVRTQIRNVVVSELANGLGVDYVVFSSRHFDRNHIDGKALVDIKISNDQTMERDTMNDARVHVASLYIRVQRDGDDASLDNDLDADEVKIVNLIDAYDWSSLLEEPPELVQVNFSDDAGTEQAIGAIVMRYDMEYRINKSDPETVIT